jgi:hypothetical protein
VKEAPIEDDKVLVRGRHRRGNDHALTSRVMKRTGKSLTGGFMICVVDLAQVFGEKLRKGDKRAKPRRQGGQVDDSLKPDVNGVEYSGPERLLPESVVMSYPRCLGDRGSLVEGEADGRKSARRCPPGPMAKATLAIQEFFWTCII